MDNYIFLSLKIFSFNKIENTIKEEQISLIVGKKYVISFQENQENDDFQNIKDRILK
jgi:magnesium transporter